MDEHGIVNHYFWAIRVSDDLQTNAFVGKLRRMEPNEIHEEIRAARDALMRVCGGDLGRFQDRCRTREEHWASAGHPVVSFEGQPPLELPPVDWEKIDAMPENEIITELRATRRALAAERKSSPAAQADSLVVREEPPEAQAAEAVSVPWRPHGVEALVPSASNQSEPADTAASTVGGSEYRLSRGRSPPPSLKWNFPGCVQNSPVSKAGIPLPASSPAPKLGRAAASTPYQQ